MEEKNIWKRIWNNYRVSFRKKCMTFDLICICLAAGAIICGAGRGEEIRQSLVLAVRQQENGQNETPYQKEGDIGEDTVGGNGMEKKKIAITFDDGPHPQYTPEMLAGLKERNVKATFFLLGEAVEKHPEIVKHIHDDGHLIGNHSYKHEQLSKMSMEQACAQVSRTNQLIYDITGEYPAFLRPPFGDWHDKLDCEVKMIEVLWDIDTLDWSSQNHAQIVQKAVTDIKEGDIILMHDGYETSVTAAMEIIDTLQKQGYEFVTVEELLFE